MNLRLRLPHPHYKPCKVTFTYLFAPVDSGHGSQGAGEGAEGTEAGVRLVLGQFDDLSPCIPPTPFIGT